ncbi:MAG: Sir2 family NAD-dependent protein deacetylase [Phenylobacterium sp.]|uniref:SIR2 family NAD-dependent protein deacylase n=1 Tax=Phenylobacterium sp. TaxID=1871053 RepID=UPI0025FF88FE|nr:Sir2 family NAD-dependent protein deacetylase [Phenylobacterium sp.]MCG9917014.1 Sir2 family NAD-dependent protein deacetylase [Phenylobacterium sp.]
MSPRLELARLIEAASNIVVFTGAGISTESGIPDFRSPGGVWSQMKPIYFQDFISREDLRRESCICAFSGRAGWTGREPNAGHHAVARLVEQGRVNAVITQNVDNLHQASGVPREKIIELHGNATYATCLACGLRHELPQLKHEFEATGDIPTCYECGELVKTATISFGQPMPEHEMRRATAATLTCDLFLVLGSSLVVYPAAEFPLLAKRRGAPLAIVNREPTEKDEAADLVVHDEIGPTLSEIVLGRG